MEKNNYGYYDFYDYNKNGLHLKIGEVCCKSYVVNCKNENWYENDIIDIGINEIEFLFKLLGQENFIPYNPSEYDSVKGYPFKKEK
jgi:hypothetical protein